MAQIHRRTPLHPSNSVSVTWYSAMMSHTNNKRKRTEEEESLFAKAPQRMCTTTTNGEQHWQPASNEEPMAYFIAYHFIMWARRSRASLMCWLSSLPSWPIVGSPTMAENTSCLSGMIEYFHTMSSSSRNMWFLSAITALMRPDYRHFGVNFLFPEYIRQPSSPSAKIEQQQDAIVASGDDDDQQKWMTLWLHWVYMASLIPTNVCISLLKHHLRKEKLRHATKHSAIHQVVFGSGLCHSPVWLPSAVDRPKDHVWLSGWPDCWWHNHSKAHAIFCLVGSWRRPTHRDVLLQVSGSCVTKERIAHQTGATQFNATCLYTRKRCDQQQKGQRPSRKMQKKNHHRPWVPTINILQCNVFLCKGYENWAWITPLNEDGTLVTKMGFHREPFQSIAEHCELVWSANIECALEPPLNKKQSAQFLYCSHCRLRKVPTTTDCTSTVLNKKGVTLLIMCHVLETTCKRSNDNNQWWLCVINKKKRYLLLCPCVLLCCSHPLLPLLVFFGVMSKGVSAPLA